MKPKDLYGLPWLLAFALRADGWFLRMDVCWNKPSPMPESINGVRWERHRVKNGGEEWIDCPGCPKCAPNDGLILRNGSWRPTKAHEYVFMLSKTGSYFCDAEAVREASAYGHEVRWDPGANGLGGGDRHTGASTRSVGDDPGTRNARSVWTIASEPLPGIVVDGEELQHFASFPTELAARCLRAGTSAKGRCPQCGAPWARVVESELVRTPKGVLRGVVDDRDLSADRNDQGANRQKDGHLPGYMRKATTLGWRATCACDTGEPVPCTVLDPFGGSGRTALAAEALGLDCTLIDLSPASCRLARAQLDRARARRAIGEATDRISAGPGQTELSL